MRPTLEIVVPVHNEESVLAENVRRLHAQAAWALEDLDVRITIADNASTDATASIARSLAAALQGVVVLQLDQKGRGRALRAAWSASSADVVAYMDVDLSTDIRLLSRLLAPLLDDQADLVIGSRLAAGAEVERSLKRELISRGYNTLLRRLLRVGFSDAQCGFKAARRRELLPVLERVENQNWFFDTELLYLAECDGLRIHELAVRWVDDPDSSVRLLATALEDLRGIRRLHRTVPRGSGNRSPRPLSPPSSVHS
jgi:glycosyltransferase involved in cell wall biosynthesis